MASLPQIRTDVVCDVNRIEVLMSSSEMNSPVVRSDTEIASSPDSVLRLRILATSDLHAHILPWDYHTDLPSEMCGLARTATLIGIARRESMNCLLVDNGDFLNGSALGDFAAEAHAGNPDARHPMISAMNWLGYDAATLGNHEFSHGVEFLISSLALAAFPVVCANLLRKPVPSNLNQPPLTPRYKILDRVLTDEAGNRQPLRIGLIGFLPPQTVTWEHRHLKDGFTADGILKVARDLVPRLRAEGADLVIALSHSGIGGANDDEGSENASFALAAVAGVDAIIAGHTHQVFPASDAALGGDATLDGKPAVMPGFYGSHLGVIDLVLARVGCAWSVASHRSEARPIARRDAAGGHLIPLVASQPEIEAIVQVQQAAIFAQKQALIGYTRQPLHSFFALVSDTPALWLVAQAQADHLRTALCGLSLPLVSAVAPFRAGGRGGPENYTAIPAGPVSLRTVADLYIHPNRIVGLKVTGKQLAIWLERSVSLFRQITPGARDAPLIDVDFPSFNFDVIYGLTWRIDLSRPARFDARGIEVDPAATRIVDLSLQGRPLQPDQELVLATNTYRSGGGNGFVGAGPDQVIHESSLTTREVLAAYIAAHGTDVPATLDTWGFVPMPGTTVVFDSAPHAVAHMGDFPALRLEPMELQPSGFQRFRIHL